MVDRLSSPEQVQGRKQRAVIIMGSGRDREHCQKITDVLGEHEVQFDVHVASAHKTPHLLSEKIREYLDHQDNYEYVFVTVAGLSNALSGHVKGLLYNAYPPITVIAAPPINELDINSSLRMPYGITVPVFTDPRNAGLFAVELFARNNPQLADKYRGTLRKLQTEVIEADGQFGDKRLPL